MTVALSLNFLEKVDSCNISLVYFSPLAIKTLHGSKRVVRFSLIKFFTHPCQKITFDQFSRECIPQKNWDFQTHQFSFFFGQNLIDAKVASILWNSLIAISKRSNFWILSNKTDTMCTSDKAGLMQKPSRSEIARR